MEKRGHRQRESRYTKRKQFIEENIESQTGLCAGGMLVTREARRTHRNVMRDEGVRHPRAKAPGMPPQDEYVQKWLAQTTHEYQVSSNFGLGYSVERASRFIGPEDIPRWSASDSFPPENRWDVDKRDRASAWNKPRKRILESSSDTSFLKCAPGSDPCLEAIDRDETVERVELQKESKTRRKRRRLDKSIRPEPTAVSLSIEPERESFEKRKRHKTREDRYEPKTALVAPTRQVQKQKQAEKKMKTKTHQRVLKSNSRDLMQQFSSKNVGLDRLTMRPSHTVGLFKNGRASSHVRRRGLPDLAFSEMEFLRCSKQLPVEIEENKSLTRSREKEKRRSERAHNEISEYFKPSKMVRDEVEQIEGFEQLSVSSNSKASDDIHQGGLLKTRYQPQFSKSPSQPTSMSTQPVFILGRREAFESVPAKSNSSGQIVRPKVALDTAKSLSDRDTSYYTWSDSMRSSEVLQNCRETASEISRTPEPIRQMLNDTGIFADTGINRNISQHHKTACRESSRAEGGGKLPIVSKDLASRPHNRELSQISIRDEEPIEVLEKYIPKRRRSRQELHTTHLQESVGKIMEGGELPQSPMASAQLYTPDSESRRLIHEDSPGSCPPSAAAENLHPGTNRQIMAERAYIRQAPATRAAGLGTCNNAAVSANELKAGVAVPHEQHLECLINGEGNPVTNAYSTSLGGSAKNLEGVACSLGISRANPLEIPHISYGDSIKASITSVSISPSESHPETVRSRGGQQDPSDKLESTPNLPQAFQQAHEGLYRPAGTELGGCTHPATYRKSFEGLPIRGSWLTRDTMPISASRPVFAPTEVEPLYKYQLEKKISHDTVNEDYNDDGHMDQLSYRFSSPLIEYWRGDRDQLHDILENECELIGSTEEPYEHEPRFPDGSDTGGFILEEEEEEEEHNPREFSSKFVSLQDEPQHHSYGEAQCATALGQHRLQVVDPNPVEENRSYLPLCEPVQESAWEANEGDFYGLNGFWQPRRQY